VKSAEKGFKVGGQG